MTNRFTRRQEATKTARLVRAIRRVIVEGLEDRRHFSSVTSSSFNHLIGPQSASVSFSANVGSSLSVADVSLNNLTDNAVVGSSNLSLSYGGSNIATFTWPGLAGARLSDGNYELLVEKEGVFAPAPDGLLDDDHQLPFWFLNADANRTRGVNLDDFSIIAANWGTNGDFEDGDLNYDGTINLDDFTILNGNFGKVLDAPASTAPGTLSISQIYTTFDRIRLNWTAPTGSYDGFRVYRRTGSDPFEQIGGDLPSTQTTYDDTDVLDGTKYEYRVRAFKTGIGNTESTNKATEVALMRAPTNVQLVPVPGDFEQYLLTWASGSERNAEFDVYMSVDNSMPTLIDADPIASGINSTTNTWLPVTLDAESDYFFYVQAKNPEIESAFSDAAHDFQAVSVPPTATDSELGCLIAVADGASGMAMAVPNYSEAGVRYSDGTVAWFETDLSSEGFGTPWAQSRGWTTRDEIRQTGLNGNGWFLSKMPYIVPVEGYKTVAVVTTASTVRYFDRVGETEEYRSRHFSIPDPFGSEIRSRETLVYDEADHEFVLIDSTGARLRFNDFDKDAFTQPIERGRFKDYGSKGHKITYLYDVDPTDNQFEIRRDGISGSTKYTESYLYTLSENASDYHARVASVTLRRAEQASTDTNPPSSWTTVRKVEYSYYEEADTHGNKGDLERAVIKDASGQVLSTSYYRYWTQQDLYSTEGYLGGLKYVFAGESYDRLLGQFGSASAIDAATNAQVSAYADRYFEYDPDGRVTQADVAGAGGETSEGIGTFTYAYADRNDPTTAMSSTSSNAYPVELANARVYKTTEVEPDGSSRIAYANRIGQVMATKEAGAEESNKFWNTLYRFDRHGRLVMIAQPSAVSSLNESLPDLAGWVIGSNPTVNQVESAETNPTFSEVLNSSGTIERFTYADYIGNFVESTKTMRGDGGSSSAGPFAFQFFGYAMQTVTWNDNEGYSGGQFRSSESTTAETAVMEGAECYCGAFLIVAPRSTDPQEAFQDGFYYSYDFFSGSTQPRVVTTRRPGQYPTLNGPHVANTPSLLEIRDEWNHTLWFRDADGFLHNAEYDLATGAQTKAITDVDPSVLPSGVYPQADLGNRAQSLREMYQYASGDNISNPDNVDTWEGVAYIPAALHLITQTQVDAFGRVTQRTNPDGTVDFVRYNDAAHETWTYKGWLKPAGGSTFAAGEDRVIEVVRHDRQSGYTEYVTLADATPNSNTAPAANPTLSGYASGSVKDYVRNLQRVFVNKAGQVTKTETYHAIPTSSYTAGTWGSLGTNFYRETYSYDAGGRLTKLVNANGTIEHRVYNTLGRLVEERVGTNDSVSGSNMTTVRKYDYDDADDADTTDPVLGGVGDGLLTKMTEFPTGSTNPRLTLYYYNADHQLAVVDRVVDPQGSGRSDDIRQLTVYTYSAKGPVNSVSIFDGTGVDVTGSNTYGYPEGISNLSEDILLWREYLDRDGEGRVFRRRLFDRKDFIIFTGNTEFRTEDSDYFYDARGNLLMEVAPGGVGTKYVYDGANRLTAKYTLAANDDFTGEFINVNGTHRNRGLHRLGDVVLEQENYTLDAKGRIIGITHRERIHDQTTSIPDTVSGALGSPGSADGHKARVSYAALYYDTSDRLIQEASLGTNGGTAWNRLTDSLPSAALVSVYDYDDADRVGSMTDPRGIVDKWTFDALNRKTEWIEAVTDSLPSAADDRITRYAYDGLSNLTKLTAVTPDGADSGTAYDEQVTEYLYGITGGSGGSSFYSNDLLGEVRYPLLNSDGSDSSNHEVQKYNALGEVKQFTDRNGTVHAYTRDGLGRIVEDAITSFGNTNVDDFIDRITYQYDMAGRLLAGTSKDASQTTLNQLTRTYGRMGEIRSEKLSHNGAVTGTTLSIGYTYSNYLMLNGHTYPEGTSGPAKYGHNRLTQITYPNGKAVTYNYGTSGGLNDVISRVSSIQDSGGSLESYQYLGLDTLIERARPQADLKLSYDSGNDTVTGEAGDRYIGLNRFGWVIDQRWTIGGTDKDRFKYGYDKNGNRLFRDNAVNGDFDELYHGGGSTGGYDKLDRLTAFARGPLSDSNSDGVLDSVDASTRNQNWTLDALGNWSSLETDEDGSEKNDPITESRTHNRQNQIVTKDSIAFSYDANGNLLYDGTARYRYDGWNRLVGVSTDGDTDFDEAGEPSYEYDALNRRISESVIGGSTTDFFYSKDWQILEERVGSAVKAQNVWSTAYIDALVARDVDKDNDGDVDSTDNAAAGGRQYAVQDANFNVTSVVVKNSSGNWGVAERYMYDPYGTPSVFNGASGFDADGSVSEWTVDGGGVSDLANPYGHQSGRAMWASTKVEFRNRFLLTDQGRWGQQDRERYIDGSSLYQSHLSKPTSVLDPGGLTVIALPPSVIGPLVELGGIINTANGWNATRKPVRYWSYECYDIAVDMEQAIRNKGPYKHWGVGVIGGRTGSGYHHHAVVVYPRARGGVTTPGVGVVLDGFKPGAGPVQICPVSDFFKEYPKPSKDLKGHGPVNPK